MLYTSLTTLSLLSAVLADRLPPTPEGLTVVQSKQNDGVRLSYKETKICETTPGVKSWAGYIHLPADEDEQRPVDINTFFWFFESRKDPANAPTSIWIQGGPGVPSITSALGENGPCIVNEDSITTTLNPWSWNNEVNMLYIDQPVGAGLSYDALVNGTINQLSSRTTGAVNVTTRDFSTFPLPDIQNQTYLAGTFASQNVNKTLNTTASAAIAAWHFLQTFTEEFPEYKLKDDQISLWTESYGGHWGPAFAEYFSKQNDLIADGSLPSTATPVEIETLGIVNGCIDLPTQMGFYPHMAYNNTHGIQAINESAYNAAVAAYPTCLHLTEVCRAAAAIGDPENLGTNATVNGACAIAYKICFDLGFNTTGGTYQTSGYNVFDIGQSVISSFPPKWASGYMNSAEVQSALGVPLNFTGQSIPVVTSFALTGDFPRARHLEEIGKLLDRGVRVSLLYGDRDYQCNWLGGENVSLAIQSSKTSSFKSAGYATYKAPNGSAALGGPEAFTRQHGPLSFTRVLDAGHEVPYYKPELAYNLFMRSIKNLDLATGTVDLASKPEYATSGPGEVFSVKNIPQGQPDALPQVVLAGTSPGAKNLCYAYDAMQTCDETQWNLLQQGKGIWKNFILIGYTADNGTEVLYNATSSHNGSSTVSTPSGPASGSDVQHGFARRVSVGMGSIMLVVGCVAGVLAV